MTAPTEMAPRVQLPDAPLDLLRLGLVGLTFVLPLDVYPELIPPVLLALAVLLAVGPRRIGPPGLEYLVAFVGVAAASLTWSLAPSRGLDMLLVLAVAVGFLAVAGAVSGDRWSLLAAAVVIFHGAVAVWQKYWALPQLAADLAEAEGAYARLALERAAGGRVFSTFALPGHLGALLAALTPILLFALLRGDTGWRRVLAGIALLAVVLGLLASSALGAAVALVLVLGAWFALRPTRHRTLTIVAGLVLLSVILSTRAPELLAGASHVNPMTTRLALWARATDVISAAPWVGEGLGSYAVSWLSYREATDVTTRYAHMSYLEIAAELGLPALALFMLFLFSVLRRSASTPIRLGALVLLVHAAIDFDLQTAGLAIPIFVLLGAASRSETGESRFDLPRWALSMMLGLAAVGSAWRGTPVTTPVVSAEVGSPDTGQGRRRHDPRALMRRVDALAAAARLDEALELTRRARLFEPRTAWLASRERELRIRRGEPFAAYFAAMDAVRFHPANESFRRNKEELESLLELSASGSRRGPLP